VQDELVAAAGPPGHSAVVTELGRYDFYDQAREASAILLTGELRPYGNLLLRKGVVAVRIP
jgi:L-fucose mutarotase